MPYTLTDADEAALLKLFPWARSHADQQLPRAFAALLEREQCRQGAPDPVSGAYLRNALVDGALMLKEYDHETHAHGAGFRVGALTVDLRSTILINQRYGFSTGDAVLRAEASCLQRLFPRGKTVRTHDDGFAVLLPPSAECPMDSVDVAQVSSALEAAVRAVLPPDGAPVDAVRFTLGRLDLTLESPAHAQVLGPLLWSECERCHLLERAGHAEGIQRRRIALDGAIPVLHLP